MIFQLSRQHWKKSGCNPEKPIKKPITYESVSGVEVDIECGNSSKEPVNYEPKPDAAVFIEKGSKKK